MTLEALSADSRRAAVADERLLIDLRRDLRREVRQNAAQRDEDTRAEGGVLELRRIDAVEIREFQIVLLGVGATFRLSDGFFPVGAHVTRECAQSAHAVGAGHFKKEIDVCDRPFRTSFEPLPQLRPHVQSGDRLSK